MGSNAGTEKIGSSNVMKRADQRSSITILVLGDGTWFRITKNKNQITALEIDMKKITNSNLQFFSLCSITSKFQFIFFTVIARWSLSPPKKRALGNHR